MKRSSVRPSVSPIVRQQWRAAGLLLSAVRTGDIETAAGTGAQQQQRPSMAFNSKCG